MFRFFHANTSPELAFDTLNGNRPLFMFVLISSDQRLASSFVELLILQITEIKSHLFRCNLWISHIIFWINPAVKICSVDHFFVHSVHRHFYEFSGKSVSLENLLCILNSGATLCLAYVVPSRSSWIHLVILDDYPEGYWRNTQNLKIRLSYLSFWNMNYGQNTFGDRDQFVYDICLTNRFRR